MIFNDVMLIIILVFLLLSAIMCFLIMPEITYKKLQKLYDKEDLGIKNKETINEFNKKFPEIKNL